MSASQLPDPNARTFTYGILRNAMLETIATLNAFADEADIVEVHAIKLYPIVPSLLTDITQPSLMNFCVTDGESVVVTRYISSRKDEAASLVRVTRQPSFDMHL